MFWLPKVTPFFKLKYFQIPVFNFVSFYGKWFYNGKEKSPITAPNNTFHDWFDHICLYLKNVSLLALIYVEIGQERRCLPTKPAVLVSSLNWEKSILKSPKLFFLKKIVNMLFFFISLDSFPKGYSLVLPFNAPTPKLHLVLQNFLHFCVLLKFSCRFDYF